MVYYMKKINLAMTGFSFAKINEKGEVSIIGFYLIKEAAILKRPVFGVNEYIDARVNYA